MLAGLTTFVVGLPICAGFVLAQAVGSVDRGKVTRMDDRVYFTQSSRLRPRDFVFAFKGRFFPGSGFET